MVTGRAAFVTARVELANDENFTILHVPDEGARIALGGEGVGGLDAHVVDAELDGRDTDFVDIKPV